MGKPGATFKANRDVKNKSNPFVVKKSTKKTKKRAKHSLEVVDKTFSELQSHSSCGASTRTLSADMGKKRSKAETRSKLDTTVNKLATETAQARIS